MLKDISILQMLLAVASAAFLFSGAVKFFQREKSQTFFKFLASTLVWGVILSFSLFPQFSHTLNSKLGFGENLNTLIFIGFILVFAILFKIINIIEKIERSISEIVRKESLEKIKTDEQ